MTSTAGTPDAAEELADQAAPLDALLVDAALGTLRRFVPDASAARLAVSLVRRPLTTGRRLRGLASEFARIGAGTSELAPAKRDRRFTDPAWMTNPVLRRTVQAYLAAGQAAGQLVADAALESRDERRIRFGVDNLVEALSPSNVPLLNPLSARAVVDTGGLNIARGGLSFLTEQVKQVPLLIVPPTINKFYALDLAQGRSMIEYLVRGGQQVFVLSWRNPDARHAGWGLDAYVQAVLDALGAVERVCGVGRTALMGVCAGGIIASITAAHLAAIGQQDRLACFGLLVTVLDTANAGTVGALVDRRLAAAAKAMSRRRGYLDGRALAEVFAWLRPGDLIWNYWVNNYLLGKKPPAFDILFWNADTTRMSATLHADFVDLAMDNKLVTPGALTVLGTDIDLARIDVDAYIVAGIADHITPWQNCYRSTQLLGGECRFILSTSGHIAALVNPPDNPKATYQTGKANPANPEDWLKAAQAEQGSWWPDMLAWLAERSGATKPAPDQLGGGGLRPIAPAPGTYVFDS